MKLKDIASTRVQLVPLHSDSWYQKQLVAGRAVAKCLTISSEMIKHNPGVNLKDLESVCEKIIKDHDCTPTFKGYKGFPGAICTSVNKNIVHGIPRDYKVKEGDVVSIDLGATYEGAIADSATTAICGKPLNPEHQVMVDKCYQALIEGIKAIHLDKNIGVIGSAIYNYVKKSHFKLITDYGGHGINWNKPHCDPFVANKANKNEGVRIQAGMALAIEPMLVMGLSDKTKVLKDSWTVAAKDIGCHSEHSVFVHSDCVEIMTLRDEEEITRKVYW